MLKQLKVGKKISESGLVSSTQKAVHPRLESYVHKHLQSTWSQPLHFPTREAFTRLERLDVISEGRPLILDSGCGTGESTRRLAEIYPDHLVIGIDRSIKRLAKSGVTSDVFHFENLILLRAELATFWRLLLNKGISPQKHFLFYPNPWPKPGHLSKRWHGHPVFPQLLALGCEIEMRCNWEVYAQEFALAAGIAGNADIKVVKITPVKSVSPFERKYLERGQPLFSVLVPESLSQAFRRSWLSNH